MRSSARRAGDRLALSAIGLIVVIWAVHAVEVGSASPRAGYPDAPVPAHTGGFGEPTCIACHFDGELNPSGGRLAISGWPEKAVADSTYRLMVSVTHEDLVLAGLQAAIRFDDGTQAGTLAPVDERTFVVEGPRGVAYVQHTMDGTAPAGERTGAWHFLWTAPSAGGEVRLHVAANAANGDRSEFGDHIYADSLRARLR